MNKRLDALHERLLRLLQSTHDPGVHHQLLSCLHSLLVYLTPQSRSLVSEWLTPLHSLYLRLCLLTHQPSLPLPTLLSSNSLRKWAFSKSWVSERGILEYYYYAGCLLLVHAPDSLPKARAAQECFVRVLSLLSAQVPSALHIEAYRKYLLLSWTLSPWVPPHSPLRTGGKRRKKSVSHKLPSYIPSVVLKACKTQSGPYHELLQALESLDFENATQALIQHAPVFDRHGNLGLAQQALDALTLDTPVCRLSTIYSCLPLSSFPSLASSLSSKSPESSSKGLLGYCTLLNDPKDVWSFVLDPLTPERLERLLFKKYLQVGGCSLLPYTIKKEKDHETWVTWVSFVVDITSREGGGGGGELVSKVQRMQALGETLKALMDKLPSFSSSSASSAGLGGGKKKGLLNPASVLMVYSDSQEDLLFSRAETGPRRSSGLEDYEDDSLPVDFEGREDFRGDDDEDWRHMAVQD